MISNFNKKTILIAPLNWGLGHATRCIPIIKALIENNYTPIIASDGDALALLRKEFPNLNTLELPSYQIEYAGKGENLKWKLFKNGLKTIKAIQEEKRITEHWIEQYDIKGIISDNRFGVYSTKVPCVYITHQLKVLSGSSTWLSSKIHQNIIKKFDACWVPDFNETPNLTGKLGHLKKTPKNIQYIGPLSRLQPQEKEKKYDLMIVLSGPEPQRGILEAKLRSEIIRYSGKIIFIRGIIEKEQVKQQIENVSYYNFMNATEISNAFNESEIVLCRSGYTTIMDLTQLNKKSFFIPTPGQFEQEYLARKLQEENAVPFASQDDFKIENLEQVANYKGLPKTEIKTDWSSLFHVFKE